jgi:hypothetical protein
MNARGEEAPPAEDLAHREGVGSIRREGIMLRRMGVILGLVVIALVSLAPVASAAGERATGNFVDGGGNVIGQVTLEQQADNAVKITVTLKDAGVVKPGMHGIHLCTASTSTRSAAATARTSRRPARTSTRRTSSTG